MNRLSGIIAAEQFIRWNPDKNRIQEEIHLIRENNIGPHTTRLERNHWNGYIDRLSSELMRRRDAT